MANKTKLATVDDNEILRRLEAGEFLRHVAKELNVSHQGLSEHLGQQQCRAALIIGQEVRLQRLLERFDELHIPPPPLRPMKRDFAGTEEYAAAVADFRGEREAWKDNSTLPAFELDKLEKQYRSESWNAERSFPERWGMKSSLHVLATFSLSAALEQMAKEDEAQVIQGDAKRMIELSKEQ